MAKEFFLFETESGSQWIRLSCVTSAKPESDGSLVVSFSTTSGLSKLKLTGSQVGRLLDELIDRSHVNDDGRQSAQFVD